MKTDLIQQMLRLIGQAGSLDRWVSFRDSEGLLRVVGYDHAAAAWRQVEVRALCTRLAVDQRGGRWQLWAPARIEGLPLAAHALINRLQQPIFPKIDPDDQAFYDELEAAARAYEEIHQHGGVQ